MYVLADIRWADHHLLILLFLLLTWSIGLGRWATGYLFYLPRRKTFSRVLDCHGSSATTQYEYD
jgi:hypothetical protein